MKNLFLLFILSVGFGSWGQRVNIDELIVSNDYFSLNGSIYNGSVYGLYDSGQLKEEFRVKNGKIDGDKITYHQDNSFRKDRYMDTSLITKLKNNLNILNDELSSLEKDSSNYYIRKRSLKSEMGDKFYNYKEKYNEGKLKGGKLEVYQDYLSYTKKLEEKTIEVGEKRIERNKADQKLNTEKGKYEYPHKKKGVYQYTNGICTSHKEYDKYNILVLEEELKDGIRNGEFKSYENGKVKEEGTYSSNKKNGVWTLYSYNGKEKITYSNDKKEGEYKKYNGDVVIEEGNYSDGLMNGEWVFRYDNGNLKGKGMYWNGDGGGNSTASYEFFIGIPANGREGSWIYYYKNGNIGNEYTIKNGKLQGEYKMYYENGQLYDFRNFSNDVLNGINKLWHENGNIKGEYTWVNGKKEGVSKWYYKSGILKHYTTWKNDKEEGKYIQYYENGNKNLECDYRNGSIEYKGSIKIIYNDKGEVKEKLEWDGDSWEKYLTPEEWETKRKEYFENQKKVVSCWWCGREYQYGDGYSKSIYGPNKKCLGGSPIGGNYCSLKCTIEECEHR